MKERPKNIAKRYDEILRVVEIYHAKLMKIDPKNNLLGLVDPSGIGIMYSPEFGSRYEGMTVYQGFKIYVGELEKEIEKVLI